MTPRRIALIPVAALAVAILPAAASAKSAGLVGEVGPGFSIEVKQHGKDVKSLKAGTYTFTIEDKASIHDFHLKGPGVDRATAVAFVGEKTWKLTLKKGTYTYQCDPHAAAGMKGSFRVTG